MLKFDAQMKELEKVPGTTLQQANILERSDLQASIVQSWEAFCGELGFEELFFVGSEVLPHDSCENRIDILALSRDGTPVVFELKRNRSRLHLLQALSYAAMVSKWDSGRYRTELYGKVGEQAEELRSLLEDDDFELGVPEVVLVAESFDPEVILSADWLDGFGVPISAFAITAIGHNDDVLLAVDQKFPLLGLDDVYEKRGRRKKSANKPTSWDEVLTKVDFPFAEKSIKVFNRRVQGNPQRRSFDSIYSASPIGRISIYFRRSYLKVYTKGQSKEQKNVLQGFFGDAIQFSTWGNENTKNKGFTFTVETEGQFEVFLAAVGENLDEVNNL